MTRVRTTQLGAGLLCLSLAACAGTQGAQGEEALDEASFSEQLLADVQRDGVQIKLYEIGPGRMAVQQIADYGTPNFFTPNAMQGFSAEGLYRQLYPDAAALPANVAKAEERRVLRVHSGSNYRLPSVAPSVEPPAPSASAPPTVYSEDWFQMNFCDIGSRGQGSVNDHGGPGGYDTYCWENGGGQSKMEHSNQYDSHISTFSVSETDTTSFHFESEFMCHFLDFDICHSNAHDDVVQPRQVLTWSTDSGFKSIVNGNWYDTGGYYGSRSQSGMND